MNTLISCSAAFLLCASVSPASAQVASISTPIPIGRPDSNLLGNGGFESWSHGTAGSMAIGPDLWLAMGSTTDFSTQNAIDFARVPEQPALGQTAPWFLEVRANAPTNFLSQSLEEFSGLGDQVVTFSMDLRTPFSVAQAKIEVFDGLTSSSADALVGPAIDEDGSPRFVRLTVTHKVNKHPTRLEFRLYPDQTVWANNAMVVVGKYAVANYVPRSNPQPGLMETPLGAILDWYRFDVNMPVPEGFAICDGSLIQDAGSPFVGLASPNLADKFVRGVTSVAAIGSSGGANSASMAHTHPIPHTHSGNTQDPHMGSGSPPAGFWRILLNPMPPWNLAANENHYHPFTTGNPSNADSGQSSVASVATVPAYVGMLKIVRIK